MTKTNSDTPQPVAYDTAVAATKEYFGGDELAATVWVSKYALKDSFGNIYETTPVQMHERLSSELGRIEKNTQIPSRKRRYSTCSTPSATSFRTAAR